MPHRHEEGTPEQEQSQTPTTKKRYNSPKLTEFGHIAKLSSKSGTAIDARSAMGRMEHDMHKMHMGGDDD